MDKVTGIPYVKGRFSGLFQRKNSKNNGKFVISDIHWHYLRIEDCVGLNDFKLEEQKTGDFWYAPKIFANKGWRPFRKTTEVFMPQGTNQVYSADLHGVLIKNITFKTDATNPMHKDWHEASGDIYFHLGLFNAVAEKKTPASTDANSIIHQSQQKATGPGNIIWVGREKEDQSMSSTIHQGKNVSSGDSSHAATPLNLGHRKAGEWISMLLGLLIIGVICYFLWQYRRIFSYILIGLFVLWLISAFGGLGRLIRGIFSLLFFGFIAYLLFNYFYKSTSHKLPVRVKSGKIKINPDRTDGADVKSEKEVNWFDFKNQFYQAKYETSKKEFMSSVETQQQLNDELMPTSQSSLDFFSKFYDGLYRMDKDKIKSLAQIFSDSAKKLKLNPLETSEMVVTFIQEIPYYLVHDGSCAEAIASGNKFMVEYHGQRKPCIGSVKGGVQSPYEFIHNLKGDCDTRSLLGFAILKEMNIGASVWISETYGHSILGVAVPAGTGMYKTLEGIKHYAVELTAKGFRVGMLSPEQAYPDNWNISIFYNN